MREFYTITELTREFEISTRTIRFYEDEGLIRPVRRGRTRLVPPVRPSVTQTNFARQASWIFYR